MNPNTTGIISDHQSHTNYGMGMTHAESAPNLTRHSKLNPKKKKKFANWKQFKNTMVPKEQEARSPIKVDWLADKRAKRAQGSKSESRRRATNIDWRQIAKREDLPDTHKMETIQETAKLIEEEARWQEKKQRAQGNHIGDAQGVNDLLIDAIEAKLCLLEEM